MRRQQKLSTGMVPWFAALAFTTVLLASFPCTSQTVKQLRIGVQFGLGYLPLYVADVNHLFEQRMRESLPLRADRVLNRVRDARGGKLYDSRFGVRGRGEGQYAEAARALFDATVKRLGMNEGFQGDDVRDTFRRPGRGLQLALL